MTTTLTRLESVDITQHGVIGNAFVVPPRPVFQWADGTLVDEKDFEEYKFLIENENEKIWTDFEGYIYMRRQSRRVQFIQFEWSPFETQQELVKRALSLTGCCITFDSVGGLTIWDGEYELYCGPTNLSVRPLIPDCIWHLATSKLGIGKDLVEVSNKVDPCGCGNDFRCCGGSGSDGDGCGLDR